MKPWEGMGGPDLPLFQKLVPEIRTKMEKNWSLGKGAPDLALLPCF